MTAEAVSSLGLALDCPKSATYRVIEAPTTLKNENMARLVAANNDIRKGKLTGQFTLVRNNEFQANETPNS